MEIDRRSALEVRRIRLTDPEAAPVLAGLSEEYEERYGPGDEMAVTQAHEFDPPKGGFFVMVADEEVIAGGGFRALTPGVCEVKRMWTRGDQRRKGYARTILAALEQAATEAGYTTLRLETGPAQPEALALYASAGYHRIAVYGRYPAALAFERPLGGTP